MRFVGREDDVITSSGYRIGPAEIEDCLLTHPAVRDRGRDGQARPAAHRNRQGLHRGASRGRHRTIEALQDCSAARIACASYSHTARDCFLDALPMTVTGKVMRAKSCKGPG